MSAKLHRSCDVRVVNSFIYQTKYFVLSKYWAYTLTAYMQKTQTLNNLKMEYNKRDIVFPRNNNADDINNENVQKFGGLCHFYFKR